MNMVWKKKWCAGAGSCFFLLLISVGLILVAYVEHEEDPSLQVITSHGTLRGRSITTREGKHVLAFTGIPFAKPPVGDLRFRSPQPLGKWKGVLDATNDAPKCTQRNILIKEAEVIGQEDCLYVNVYTPHIQGHHLLDVMVFIHGGGWFCGAGSDHDPSYLLDKDVVLVTFNYRLGPLGFLSTGDSVCPGNNGLKDQVSALKWVRDNIAAFGGNPGSVTIFGRSAGGASVHYHMLSPASRGLFHRAISQSGTALCSWSFALTTDNTEKLAALLDCPIQSSTALIDCLRKKEATEIIGTDKEFMEWSIHPVIPFKPMVEKGEEAFLPATPLQLAKNLTNTVPWMTGIAPGDGVIAVTRVVEDGLISDLDENFEDILPITLFFSNSSSQKAEISKEIKQFYFGERNITNSSVTSLVNLYTDNWFLHGADQSIRLHSEVGSAPVYYYYFTHKGSRSFSTLFGNTTGPNHGDELLYLFTNNKIFPENMATEEDEVVIDLMTTLWANFAHTGNPSPMPYNGVTWPRVTDPNNSEYVQIEKDGLHVKQGLLKERTKFWDSLPINYYKK